MVPNWRTEKENPIFKYVSTGDQPFTNESELLFNDELHNKIANATIRENRLYELQGKDRSSLMLAGTVALKNAKTSPWTVMKQREGFVTKFHVPTILETKMTFSKEALNEVNKRGHVVRQKENPYDNPKEHQFRDLELRFNQKDFVRQLKGDAAYNPHFLSEFNSRPQVIYAKERKIADAEKEQKKEDYLVNLKGAERALKPEFVKYHHVPEKLLPITQGMKDRYLPPSKGKQPEPTQFMPKDEYMTGYQKLA